MSGTVAIDAHRPDFARRMIEDALDVTGEDERRLEVLQAPNNAGDPPVANDGGAKGMGSSPGITAVASGFSSRAGSKSGKSFRAQ